MVLSKEIAMIKDKTQVNEPGQQEHDNGKPDKQRDPEPRKPLEQELPNKEQEDGTKPQEAKNQKATRFDGSPNPHAAPNTALKPQDDTPSRLEKRSGPRDDQ